MGNLKAIVLSIVTAFQLIVSSIFPGAHRLPDTTAKTSFDLPKQALQQGTRKIVELSKNTDLKKLSASLPGVQIINLGNGRYIVIGGSISSDDLQNELSKLKDIRKIDTPKPVKIINPIQKSAPVQAVTPQTDKAVNDPYYKYEWYIGATGSSKSWSLVKQQREITVAVLDTGIDYNHPDLKNRILTDLGYNFLDGTKDATDDNGHGTHVSGIIAAQANNNQGITGVAGGLDVKIIPIKVLNSNGEGDTDIIAKGIRYAADAGADIINMSFGAEEKDVDIDNAIQYARSKGVFMVAAAGNDSKNASLYSPAGNEGVFTVAAVNENLKRASFSNYGSVVQVSSPGVSILSTIPGGKYQAWDGTSMAAPIVSGIAAILKAENPSLTPDQLSSLLDTTAQNVSSTQKTTSTGYGIVNAYNAIKKLEELK